MTLFDPASGAWFPDVSQAMLGRERQTQATLGQIGQREDVNRQQKLQDDELKRKNKVIRGIGKQLAGAGMLTNPQTGMPLSVTEMDMESTDAIAGHIAGSEAIWKRDAQMEQQQTSDLNQAAARFNIKQAEEDAGRIADFRELMGVRQDDLSSVAGIPKEALTPQDIQPEISDVVDKIMGYEDKASKQGLDDSEQAALRKLKASLLDLDRRKQFVTPDTPVKEVGLGQRPMSPSERGNEAFLASLKSFITERADQDKMISSGANLAELNTSIENVNRKQEAVNFLKTAPPRLRSLYEQRLPPIAPLLEGGLLTPATASTMRPQETWRQEEVKDKDGNAVGIMNISNLTGKKTISPYPTATSAKPRAKVLDAKAPYSNKTEEVQAGIYDIQNEINKINASAIPNNPAVTELEAKRDAAQVRLNTLTAIEGIPSATVREKWERFMTAYARIMENALLNPNEAEIHKIFKGLPTLARGDKPEVALQGAIEELTRLLN